MTNKGWQIETFCLKLSKIEISVYRNIEYRVQIFTKIKSILYRTFKLGIKILNVLT